MADDPNSLWSVALGGGLTLVGGVLGGGITLLSKMMDVNADKNRRSVEKFEEIVAAVYELEHWLDKKRDVEGFGNEAVEVVAGPAPYAKLEAIPAVYFPEINRALLSALIREAQTYEGWIATASVKRLSGNAANEITAGYDEMIRKYTTARNDLLGELETYARKNIRARRSPRRAWPISIGSS